MTKPTTKKFGDYIIKVGTSQSPDTLGSPCGLTSKGFSQTANAQETQVPDCTNPDAPAYIERGIDTLSGEISGSGIMAVEAFTTWQSWFDAATSRICRIYPMGATGGYYEGLFVLTKFNTSVQLGQKVQVDLTMESDGQFVWNVGP